VSPGCDVAGVTPAGVRDSSAAATMAGARQCCCSSLIASLPSPNDRRSTALIGSLLCRSAGHRQHRAIPVKERGRPTGVGVE
jgi:hypothetical protein